jgi:pyrimidine-nucleoside phosphorylase
MDLWISAPGFLSLLKKTKTAIAYPPETLTVLFEPHNKKSKQSQYLQNTGASLLLSPPHGAVFHVKIGAGSWVKTDQAGTALVERLKSLCQSIGINHSVLFSNDFQPLGQALGGVPAMREALDILQGTGPLDFLKLTLELGADALRLILPRSQKTEVKIFLKNLILSGKAADKLPEVIQKQGGNPKIVDTLCSRSEQMVRIVCTAPRGGFIQKISWARTRALQKKIETVDTDAGIVFQKKTGDPVKRGEILGEICLSKAQKKRGFKEAFKKIFLFSETPPPFQPLIKGRI